jgi:hypothetical protein
VRCRQGASHCAPRRHKTPGNALNGCAACPPTSWLCVQMAETTGDVNLSRSLSNNDDWRVTISISDLYDHLSQTCLGEDSRVSTNSATRIVCAGLVTKSTHSSNRRMILQFSRHRAGQWIAKPLRTVIPAIRRRNAPVQGPNDGMIDSIEEGG